MIFAWTTYYEQGLYAGAGAYRGDNWGTVATADVSGPPIGSLLLMGCGRILIPFMLFKNIIKEILNWQN